MALAIILIDFKKIMNLTGKHTIKTIILWIGIVTALLLIIGSVLQFNYTGVGLEMSRAVFNQDHLKGFISLIHESLQWLKP